jgi:hypothetical protein
MEEKILKIMEELSVEQSIVFHDALLEVKENVFDGEVKPSELDIKRSKVKLLLVSSSIAGESLTIDELCSICDVKKSQESSIRKMIRDEAGIFLNKGSRTVKKKPGRPKLLSESEKIPPEFREPIKFDSSGRKKEEMLIDGNEVMSILQHPAIQKLFALGVSDDISEYLKPSDEDHFRKEWNKFNDVMKNEIYSPVKEAVLKKMRFLKGKERMKYQNIYYRIVEMEELLKEAQIPF